MSLFQQLVFKTFSFLALFCFFSSSVFADKTYTYYKTLTTPLVCSTSANDICSLSVSRISSPATRTYSLKSCNTNSDPIQAFYQYTDNNPASGSIPAHTTTMSGSGNAGFKLSKICKDDEKFVLDGCTASCVPDPCKALKGGTFSKKVECGSVTCPNGGVIVDNGILSCSKGAGLWLPRPLQSTADPSTSCEGSIDNSFVPTSVQVKNSAIGSSSTTGYCSATYTYSGSSGSATASESDLVSMAFSSVTETTEDGQCPSGTKKGSYALGENGATKWVCVPDSGSDPDPTDPTDPQNCPTGQHKDTTTGQCVPDTNTGGGGSGGSGDGGGGDGDGDSGGSGGGGGGGGSGGSGGSPNIDDTTGETGSGSQTGAGGKATASTAEGCGTPPTCSGDPLQCAAFVQDWKQNCQMMSVTQGDADRANALSKASNDEHKAKLTAQEQKATGFFNDFKTTANTSTTSQCPNDLTLPVMGKSIVLKLSDTCSFWRFLRILIIASAYLAAARIVFKTIA